MNSDLKDRIRSFLKEQESGFIEGDDGESDYIDYENVANLDMFLQTAIGLLKEVVQS